MLGDAADEQVLAQAVALAEDRHGGLDAAFAVAGVVAGGVPLWEQPAEQVQAVLEIDLHAVVALARVAVPALLRRPAPRSGRFVAVASTAATRGLPMLAAYCAAKAGVTGLVRALAVELGPHGVTANAVSPGCTDTAILDESARLYGMPAGQAFVPQQPLGRLLDPEEVAAALVWLAGEGARWHHGGGAAGGRRAGAVVPGDPVAPPVVALDRRARVLDGGRVLLGGDPGRLLTLRTRSALADALGGRAPALAARLVAAGLAHPQPEARDRQPVDVVVVVPVRDRAAELDRCLAALGSAHPVLVVDDGSRDPAAVAEVAARHGARLLALPVNGGPAAARNAGLAATDEPVVAFVDSDCAPPPGWLAELAGHLADPAVAAVAPRVRSRAGRSLLARYARARGPLDLGPDPAAVRPGGRVPYVPTAALLVRREALGPQAFDPALRFGEDVDLVWRLHDAGRTVRYVPSTVVLHDEPDRWTAWLRRRHLYGTSAAPLAARHGARLSPLVLPPWPTAAWLLLAAGRPCAGGAVAAVPAVRLARVLRRAGVGRGESVRAAAGVTAQGVASVAGGLGGAGSVLTLPLLLAGLLPRRTRRAALAVLLVPPLLEHRQRRPDVDPLRWAALRLLDDLAYASGVWRGCWRARSTAALRPRRSRPS